MCPANLADRRARRPFKTLRMCCSRRRAGSRTPLIELLAGLTFYDVDDAVNKKTTAVNHHHAALLLLLDGCWIIERPNRPADDTRIDPPPASPAPWPAALLSRLPASRPLFLSPFMNNEKQNGGGRRTCCRGSRSIPNSSPPSCVSLPVIIMARRMRNGPAAGDLARPGLYQGRQSS